MKEKVYLSALCIFLVLLVLRFSSCESNAAVSKSEAAIHENYSVNMQLHFADILVARACQDEE